MNEVLEREFLGMKKTVLKTKWSNIKFEEEAFLNRKICSN